MLCKILYCTFRILQSFVNRRNDIKGLAIDSLRSRVGCLRWRYKLPSKLSFFLVKNSLISLIEILPFSFHLLSPRYTSFVRGWFRLAFANIFRHEVGMILYMRWMSRWMFGWVGLCFSLCTLPMESMLWISSLCKVLLFTGFVNPVLKILRFCIYA